MQTLTKSLVGIGLICIAVAASSADDPLEKAVKARQGYMQATAFNVGILGAMVKGETEYDADAASTAANNIKLLSMMSNGAMWPQGSGNDNDALKTRALPEIWSTYPAIADKGKAFGEAAAQLADVAGNGLDEMKSAFGAVGKSCKGCHDDFRASDK